MHRLLGLPAEALAHGRDLTALLGELTAEPPMPPCFLNHTTPDGRLLRLVVEPLSDGGFSLAAADVTSVRAAAQALREARDTAEAGARAKARFLATMNHELRTPLNTVIGFAETLAYDAAQSGSPPDQQQTQEFALHIRDAGRRLLALIDDILDFVRIDSGSYELAADTIDVARLVQTAVRGVEDAAREGGLALSSRDETGAIRLSADERRLRRLLGHLLGNAIKFTTRGGAIAVVSRLDEAGDLCIEVRDNGIGMSPGDLKRVLQPFDQLDARHARRAGGAGIGLHLSRSIAEAHDGALRLQSAPGEGTTATLVLPRARLLEPSPSLKLAQETP
jgi:signal transduction histidine kinase